MTRRRWVTATLGLVLVAIVAVVWVIPIVSGPAVECIDINPVACDQAWRAEAAAIGGVQQMLPVTKAWVQGSPEVTCVQVYIEWLGGASSLLPTRNSADTQGVVHHLRSTPLDHRPWGA